TGDVVGFVGNTGDAAGGPWHDHFEWHPAQVPARAHMSPYGVAGLEGAVDPCPYLLAACGRSATQRGRAPGTSAPGPYTPPRGRGVGPGRWRTYVPTTGLRDAQTCP